MNIFVTNECPVQSAIEHNDTHLRKQLIEAGQLLSTAHYVLDKQIVGMKPTHVQHPSAVWARKTSGNYKWLYQHYVALCTEYLYRTGKEHASSRFINELSRLPSNILHEDRTFFTKAMPDEHKAIPNAVLAYQSYLNSKFVDWQTRTDKKQMPVAWTKRPVPVWVNVCNIRGEAE